MPLLAIFLPVLLGHIGLTAALGAVTLPQWIAIAAELLKALPAVQRDLQALHPVFKEMFADLQASGNHRLAAITAHDYMQRLKANASAAISVQDALPK